MAWPAGPVCQRCYKHSRSHPGTCTNCGMTAVLVGPQPDNTGANTTQAVPAAGWEPHRCGPCSGRPDLSYTCSRCQQPGFFHTSGLCLHCQLADSARALLTDAAGQIPPQLVPFADALRDARSPGGPLQWLAPGRPAAELIAGITAAGEPVSHDLLDTFPQTLPLHRLRLRLRLRQTLVHTGVLEPRADYLERLVPWLEAQLADQPAARAHLVRTWVHWTLLRRARYRARSRPFTAHAGGWLRTRVLAAVNLLNWLDTQDTTLADLRQHQLDQWLTVTPTDATYAAREFLHWATSRRLTSDVAIPKRPQRSNLDPITDEQRWTQLRRCLHDGTLPTAVRAAGALVLLYGLPVSRISTLNDAHIGYRADGTTTLHVGDQPLSLPPAVAALIHAQRRHGAGTATLGHTTAGQPAWLFPGGLPGRPARDAIYRALRHHLPVHLRRARSAALATLAADLPPAILADLLDLNIRTAEAWATYAQHDWSAYLAARTGAQAAAGGQATRSPTAGARQ